MLEHAAHAMGPYNVYNIYDNCPAGGLRESLASSGKSMHWLKQQLREQLLPSVSKVPLTGSFNSTGGYDWSCGGQEAAAAWITRPDVRKALHLLSADPSAFKYDTAGPASITLWPFLATKLRVLIYNGDADACVPYKGNEEWIGSIEKNGDIREREPWRPWFTSKSDRAPAGYVTTFEVPANPATDFSFVTIRLAGHMVPTFQPAPALALISRFLSRSPM